MTDVILGQLLKGTEHKDAIHIAIMPIQAGHEMSPGQHIGIKDSKAWDFFTDGVEPLGIVDPFLKERVKVGQWFYMFLYQNTITSLRHEWTHPKIEAAVKNSSEAWLMSFADRYRINFYQMIESASKGQRIYQAGDNGAEATSEFWHHIEIYTDKKFDEEHRDDVYFSCSC